MVKKILVFGAGYVGSSLGLLLSQYYDVVIVDTDYQKVKKINNKQAPIHEPLMQDYFDNKSLNFSACKSYEEHIQTTDLIIISLPTNYDEKINHFDTSILESVISDINKKGYLGFIVIKSTVPIGFTEKMSNHYPNLNITFVPEFLREGKALLDNIEPSRIVIGYSKKKPSVIADVFLSIAKNSPNIFYMGNTEAEAVKLFANTYLATRISFFNELDSFAFEKELNAKDIIDGISSDPRIGKNYNNPSFGYGGYCLPKDTKQLLANFNKTPQEIFTAVVKSNSSRKDFIAQKILSLNVNQIGIFRLTMKKGSENFRESSVFDIMKILQKAGRNIIIYEPLMSIDQDDFCVTHDLDDFKKLSEVILANRMEDSLIDVESKVFTRDVYGEN